MLYEDPEETKYMEAAVALKVKYNGNIYTSAVMGILGR